MVTIFLFWKLTKTLFPKKAGTQTIATIIFSIFTTIPLLEGNIVNAELFMIGPIILAFTILLTKPLIPKNLICAGVLFSLATLFKVPAAFDVPVIIFFWILTAKKLDKKTIVQISKSTTYLLIGFCFPILLTFIWYFLHGAFSEYLIAAYLQNFGYLSSWRPEDVQSSFLIKNLPLISRMGVVGLGFVLLYLKRNKLSKRFLFLTTWLLFSLFAVTLSERPYPHYLIQSVPSLVLLLTIFFTDETVEQSLTIIPLALAFFVPIYFNFWYY